MSLRALLEQHLLTEVVEIPNSALERRGWILQLLLRRKLKVRFMPKYSEVEVKARFEKILKLSGDEELALFQAIDRIKEKQGTPEDTKLILSYQTKVEDIKILSAMYAAVIVKPGMSENDTEALLRGFTQSDFARFVERMDRYVKVTEEAESEIKNSSAPRHSPI